MTPDRPVLFPETDPARAEALLPHVETMAVLEAVNPVRLPPWAAGRVAVLRPLAEAALRAEAKAALAAWREFAALHGEAGALAAAAFAPAPPFSRETRPGIQAALRGRPKAAHDPAHAALIEAAVFLELAREADQRARELSSRLDDARRLEARFAEILGGEGDDDALPLDAPLPPPAAPPAGLLSRRMAAWLRLFAALPVGEAPLLACPDPETLAVALEALETHFSRLGRPFAPVIETRGALRVTHVPGATLADLAAALAPSAPPPALPHPVALASLA